MKTDALTILTKRGIIKKSWRPLPVEQAKARRMLLDAGAPERNTLALYVYQSGMQQSNGQARTFPKFPEAGIILLARQTLISSPEYQDSILRHEAAHILAAWQHGRASYANGGHNDYWRAACQNLGLHDHTVESVPDLANAPWLWKYTCTACGAEMTDSRRFRSKKWYHPPCMHTGKPLRLIGKV